jgi:hypothetical protein
VVTQCEDCGRGFQHANGELVALDPAIVEMCDCDAQHVTIAQAHETLSRAATGARGDAPGEPRSDAHVDAVGDRAKRSRAHRTRRQRSVARCSCATEGAVSFQVVEMPATWTFTIWICARKAAAMIPTIWWCCAGHTTARCTAVACTSTGRCRRGSASATPMGPPTGSCRRQCWRRRVRAVPKPRRAAEYQVGRAGAAAASYLAAPRCPTPLSTSGAHVASRPPKSWRG